MDSNGLDALSTRRIAKQIGVNGASLYHHFKNKDEIINGAMELALSRTRLRRAPGSPNWEASVIAGTYQLRDFLLEHPYLLPVFSEKRAAGLGSIYLESTVKWLLSAGMPHALIAPLFEALEAFTVGWTMGYFAREQQTRSSAQALPILEQANRCRNKSTEEVYDRGIAGIVRAITATCEPAVQS